jgi:hypothetical protein
MRGAVWGRGVGGILRGVGAGCGGILRGVGAGLLRLFVVSQIFWLNPPLQLLYSWLSLATIILRLVFTRLIS